VYTYGKMLPPAARHQPRSLQRLLHPGVTQFDPVLGLQRLVKVLHVQIELLFPGIAFVT
jgi:hypothetical protein